MAREAGLRGFGVTALELRQASRLPPVYQQRKSEFLEDAGRPVCAHEIHAAAEQLAGEPLLWKSVKAALAANVTGEQPRFRRVRRSVYQLARDVRRCSS